MNWTFRGITYQTKRDYYAAIVREWLSAGGLNSRLRSLRKRLGLKPPIEEIRAQTRERVRRHRERAKGHRISPEGVL